MPKVVYGVESFKDFWKDAKGLLEDHYKEIGLYNDKVVFNPATETYEGLCDLGLLHIITAREEGVLVGYCVTTTSPHLHYKDSLIGNSDVFYLRPEYRKGFTGVRLIKKMEEHMRGLGVDVLSFSFKTYAPLDSLFERLGWDYSERIYTKYIGV